MDKKILSRIEDEQKRFAISKIIDTVNLASKHYEAKFTHFLDPAVSFFVEREMHFEPDVKVTLFGGYEDAERKILCASPEWEDVSCDSFPLKCIKAVSSGFDSFTHRDYLGSLMGLGLEREQIGDILVLDGEAYIFCKADVFSYILNNLERIGRGGIKLSEAKKLPAKITEKKVKEISFSTASMRLDAILSGALNISRNVSSELIRTCRVKVNFDECTNLSKILSCGDLISVRGFGRLRVSEIGGETKKGRTYVYVEKYI